MSIKKGGIKMKKLFIGLFMIGAAFAFTACNTDTSETTNLLDEIEESIEFESADQVFVLEALSAATILDYSDISMLTSTTLGDITTEEPITTEETTDGEEIIVDEQISEIDQYLEMIENFLGDNDALAVQALVSDRAEWENLISFTTRNILGEEIVYFMYYNETLFVSEDEITTEEPTTEVPTTEEPTTETPTTEVPTTEVPTTEETTTALGYTVLNQDNEGERNFYFEDDDDNEVIYLLSGLIISDGIEYNVEGKKVIEDNGDEIMRLRSFVDRDNYVKVSYMLDAEDNTEKFFFEVVTDGVLISSSKVKVSEEDGELKLFMEMATATESSRYVFKVYEEDGTTIYQIRYDIKIEGELVESGIIHIYANIDPETGDTVYTYRILTDMKDQGKPDDGEKYKYQEEHKHENREHRGEHDNDNDNM